MTDYSNKYNNLKNKFLVTFILLSIIISFFITTNLYAKEREKVIIDAAGRKVSIPRNIERIVGVGPGALRMIVYLKESEKVVGVEEFEKMQTKRPYILAHPELLELPSIGPQFGGDSELIAASEPDIIFSSYTSKVQADKLQQKVNKPVVVITDGGAGSMNLSDFKTAINITAAVLNKEKRAEKVINYYNSEIKKLKEKTTNIKDSKQFSAYIGAIGQKGAHGILSTEGAYPSFQFLNIKNSAADISLKHAMISAEKLLEWNPEYIFVDEGGYSLAIKDLKENKFSYLSAIKKEKVYAVLPYNHYTTNFATILVNSYYIGEKVYKDSFGNINLLKKADEIYNFFVGENVYKEMTNIFGGYKKVDLEEK